MEDGWGFSGLFREAPFCIMALSDFFLHFYRSHTLFICVWYESTTTSWDRDGFIEGSIGAANFRCTLAQARLDQLNLLYERRLRVVDHVHTYQRKMVHTFKKRVKPRPLQMGDLVLRVIKGLIRDSRGKFRPSWSKPYFIRELTLVGVPWLIDLDGNQFSESSNSHRMGGHHFY